MALEDKNIKKKSLRFYTILFLALGILLAIPGYLNDSKLLRGVGHLLLISVGLMWLYYWKVFQWTQAFFYNIVA